MFRAKGALTPRDLIIKPPPPQNQRKRGGKAEFVNEKWGLRKAPVWVDGESPKKAKSRSRSRSNSHSEERKAREGEGEGEGSEVGAVVEPNLTPSTIITTSSEIAAPREKASDSEPFLGNLLPEEPSQQLSTEEILEKVSHMEPLENTTAVVQGGNLYCPECYLPLHPDPKPERLYIFLHALKYTTSLGTFETGMPEWSAKGWTWDRS